MAGKPVGDTRPTLLPHDARRRPAVTRNGNSGYTGRRQQVCQALTRSGPGPSPTLSAEGVRPAAPGERLDSREARNGTRPIRLSHEARWWPTLT